jgi:hypothetical protein
MGVQLHTHSETSALHEIEWLASGSGRFTVVEITPNNYWIGWASEPVWTRWSRESPLDPVGNRTTIHRSPDPLPNHCTDEATPAPTVKWISACFRQAQTSNLGYSNRDFLDFSQSLPDKCRGMWDWRSTTVSKLRFFWDVTPCGLVDGYQRLEGTCYLYLQGRRVDLWDVTPCVLVDGRHSKKNSLLKEVEVIFAETISIYRTTWRHILEDSAL